MKKITSILRIFIGIFFIFSAILKLYPIQYFEYIIRNLHFFPNYLIPYLARILISLEICIGITFIANFKLKNFVIPISLILLSFFQVILIFQIAFGNNGDCGCFGQLFPTPPIVSIVKNLILFGTITFLFFKTENLSKKFIYLPIFICTVAIFTFFPIKTQVSTNISKNSATNNYYVESKQNSLSNNAENMNKKKTIKEKEIVKVKSIFSDFNTFSEIGKVDINSGLKILAFLSLSCEHCQKTALEITQLKIRHQNLQVLYYFLGSEEDIEPFFLNGGSTFPYMFLRAGDFFNFVDGIPPRVFILENGNIVADFQQEEFPKEQADKIINKYLNSHK